MGADHNYAKKPQYAAPTAGPTKDAYTPAAVAKAPLAMAGPAAPVQAMPPSTPAAPAPTALTSTPANTPVEAGPIGGLKLDPASIHLADAAVAANPPSIGADAVPSNDAAVATPARALGTASNTSGPGGALDLDQFRLTQDFAAATAVKRHVVTVPVRKPNRQEFVRVHPDSDWRLTTAILNLKEERETYIVVPKLWPNLNEELVRATLYAAMTRQGTFFIWPVRMPGADGRLDEWSRSAHEGAELATRAWVKVAANMNLGAYELGEAQGVLPDPMWPSETFADLFRIAFRGKVIDDIDHPVLRKLRGEV
jgi:hypothetical protein